MDRNLARQRILATIDSIPPGRTASYGEVAAEAGLAGRARLVARVLRELPARSGLPWHRVIAAGGRLARHPGAAEQRRALLAEGVRFVPGTHRLLRGEPPEQAPRRGARPNAAAPRAQARGAASQTRPGRVAGRSSRG